jgi:hypothetical protein
MVVVVVMVVMMMMMMITLQCLKLRVFKPKETVEVRALG